MLGFGGGVHSLSTLVIDVLLPGSRCYRLALSSVVMGSNLAQSIMRGLVMIYFQPLKVV